MRVPQLLLTALAGLLFAACTTNQEGIAVTSEVAAPTPAPPAPRIQTPSVEPKEHSHKVANQEPVKKSTNTPETPSPPKNQETGTSSGSKARASLEDQAKEFARQNGGKLPTADQVGAMAGKIDANSIQKATDLINQHKGQLPNKAELQQLIDQIDPATIEKAKKALQDSGLLETIEGQIK